MIGMRLSWLAPVTRRPANQGQSLGDVELAAAEVVGVVQQRHGVVGFGPADQPFGALLALGLAPRLAAVGFHIGLHARIGGPCWDCLAWGRGEC